jgi:hypothetical protein
MLYEPAMRDVTTRPQWTDDELRTLIRFRARLGRRWKTKLLDLYLSGRDDSEPEGSGLRHIRNRHGPSRVRALKACVLDEATIRLGTVT